MARKRFRPEEIIHKPREAEVELSQGKKTPEVCKKLGVSQQRYYRWRKEYGGLKVDQAKRLKDLELSRSGSRLTDPAISVSFRQEPDLPVLSFAG